MDKRMSEIIFFVTFIYTLSAFQRPVLASAFLQHLSKPRIQNDMVEHVQLGERIEFVCCVIIPSGLAINLKWNYHQPNAGPTNRTFDISQLKIERIGGRKNLTIVRRALTIAKATLSHSGTYSCEGQINNVYKYVRFTINVTKQQENRVTLHDTYDHSEIHVRVNETDKTPTIRIDVAYVSYPPDVTVTWEKDKKELTTQRGEKSQNGTHITLFIHDPSVHDTGNYTASVRAGKAFKTHQIRVFVYAKPRVLMKGQFVEPGEMASFECRSIGYPRPAIFFHFRPCGAVPWKNCSEGTINSPVWNTADVQSNDTQISKTRVYNVIAETPGIVYCRATNTEGSGSAQADLLISNLKDSVTLEQEKPEEVVTVGDNVTIICSALVYNYTSDVMLMRGDMVLLASANSYSPERYAWQTRFDITMVTHEHAGPIICRAKSLGNVTETREFSLEVLDPAIPRLLSGKMNQSLLVELHNPLKLECDVEGVPHPKIVWKKDNVPLQIDEGSKRVHFMNISVYFEYLKMEDLGMFECFASNKMGSISKYWNVEMQTTLVRMSIIYSVISLLLVLSIAIVMMCLFYCRKVMEIEALKEAGIAYFEEGNQALYNPDLALSDQADLLPYDPVYEFAEHRLTLGRQLGTGAFGMVMMGTAKNIIATEHHTTVAVKMVKNLTDNEAMRALILELKIMIHLGQHLNVVNLLGAVTKNIAKRKLMVIVEYCRYGNLQNFLIKHRPHFVDQMNHTTGEIDAAIGTTSPPEEEYCYEFNSYYVHGGPSQSYVDPNKCFNTKKHAAQGMAMGSNGHTKATRSRYIQMDDMNAIKSNEGSSYAMDSMGPARSVTTTDLACWASQIACGMEYLASRKVLHGDLAARNILLSDDNIVKICDFGLSRSMCKNYNYRKDSEAPLPFKWLALECLSDNVFSTYSDVWAYGILLWELYSLGMGPYPGMEANVDLYRKLNDGYRMDKPHYSNQDIYDIMLRCWYVKPDTRPSFGELKNKFRAMLPDETWDHYMELNQTYLQTNPCKGIISRADYMFGLASPDVPAPSVPTV